MAIVFFLLLSLLSSFTAFRMLWLAGDALLLPAGVDSLAVDMDVLVVVGVGVSGPVTGVLDVEGCCSLLVELEHSGTVLCTGLGAAMVV